MQEHGHARIIEHMYGVEFLEQRLDIEQGFKPNVLVDIDVTGLGLSRIDPTFFPDRKAAIRKLDQTRGGFGDLNVLPVADQRVTLAGELQALAMYLRVKDGEEIDFATLMKQTLGVDPIWMSESDVIEETERQLKEMLARVGFRDANLTRSFIAFRAAKPLSPDVVRDRMIDAMSNDLPVVMACLGEREIDPRFYNPEELIELAEEDLLSAAARMECNHRGRLRIKVNPKKDFYQGEEVYFARHEALVHGLDYDLLERNITGGRVEQSLGVFTQIGRRPYAGEGLAQTLHKFLPFESNDYVKIAYLLREYREYVLNNAHILANLLGSTPQKRVEEGIDYAANHLKILTENEIREEVEDRRMRPFERIYFYAYGIGMYDFTNMAENLSPYQRCLFVKKILGKPYSPAAIHHIYQEIKAVCEVE